MSQIILPDSPLFHATLYGSLPPGSSPCGAFVISSESGLMRPATPRELEDYIEGGEYDEVMGDELDDSEFEAE
jgi:hypothetical protein